MRKCTCLIKIFGTNYTYLLANMYIHIQAIHDSHTNIHILGFQSFTVKYNKKEYTSMIYFLNY